MIVAELRSLVSFAPPTAPDLPATVLVTGTPNSPTLPGTLNFDSTPVLAARGLLPQVAGFVVFVNGQEIPLQNLLANFSVEFNLDSFLAIWRLSAPLPSPFGNPRTYAGPPPGLGVIDIYGAYLTPTGRHLIPLITAGIVDSEDREIAQDGSRLAKYQGVDAGGRYDHRKVTLLLPPGHGLTRSQVVALVGSKISMPTGVSSSGQTMMHEFQLLDADWYPSLKELMAVEGQTLAFDGGALVSISTGFDPGRAIDLEITEREILEFGVSVSSQGEVVTRIIITGAQQLTKDAKKRQVIEIVKSESPYAPAQAYFRQNVGGSLSSNPRSSLAATLRVTSQVVTTREYEYDTLLSEVVLSYAFYKPVSARYIQMGDGSREHVQDVYIYESGATANDAAQAFTWPAEQFVLVLRKETTYTYDDRGFLVSQVTRSESPALANADLRFRATTDIAWTTATYSSPRFLLGSGAGVVGLPSTIDLISQTLGREVIPSVVELRGGCERQIDAITYSVTNDGFLHAKVETQQAYANQQGSLHLFSGGAEFASATETFQVVSRVTTSYVASGEANHDEIVTTLGLDGKVASIDTKENVNGYLPAATKSLNLIPSSQIYANPTQALAAEAASRFDSVPLMAEYVSWPLEASHPKNEARLASQGAENAYELLAIAEREVREGARIPIKITLLANFFIKRGWVLSINLQLPDIDLLGFGEGVPFLIYVRQVAHKLAGPDGPLTTEVTGSCYLAA